MIHLHYENVPIILSDYSLIITNSNKRRGLTDSKYNERRSECDKAVELLRSYKPIRNLSEINSAEINILEEYIKDPVVRKRAKHVISENGRVVEAVKVLKDNNISRFGELMNQSHDSLKMIMKLPVMNSILLYMKEESFRVLQVLRMTGAGFGGCTISIVGKDDSA